MAAKMNPKRGNRNTFEQKRLQKIIARYDETNWFMITVLAIGKDAIDVIPIIGSAFSFLTLPYFLYLGIKFGSTIPEKLAFSGAFLGDGIPLLGFFPITYFAVNKIRTETKKHATSARKKLNRSF